VGKSATLRRIVESLRGRYGDACSDKVAVSAATGHAASAINGFALHHLAGVGVPYYVDDFLRMDGRRDFWTGLEVLVIDEISMISGEFLDLFDRQLRRIRGSDEPFGGLQLVLSGDPFQLAPTEPSFKDVRGIDMDKLNENRRAIMTGWDDGEMELFLNRGMFFHSDAFWRLDTRTVELHAHHRQSSPEYHEALQALRSGGRESQKQKAIDFFNERVRPIAEDDSAVRMVATIARMRDINEERLSQLPSEPRTFGSEDRVLLERDTVGSLGSKDLYAEQGGGPEDVLRSSPFFKDCSGECPALGNLELKVGARVVLVADLPWTYERLVNGQTGTVIAFSPTGDANWVEVDFDGVGPRRIYPHGFESSVPGLGTCIRNQIPLQLAWAITHHRSQGQTLSKVRIDPYASEGLLYAALSRCRGIDGLELTEYISPDSVMVNPDATTFMRSQGNRRAQKRLGSWREKPVPESLWDHLATNAQASVLVAPLTGQGRAQQEVITMVWPPPAPHAGGAREREAWSFHREGAAGRDRFLFSVTASER
jgi:hypothetical protein